MQTKGKHLRNTVKNIISLLIIFCMLLILCSCGLFSSGKNDEENHIAVENDDPGTAGKDYSAVSGNQGDHLNEEFNTDEQLNKNEEIKLPESSKTSSGTDIDYNQAWEESDFPGSENTIMTDQPGSDIAAFALQFEGYPYTIGGTSPSTGFDCSGFVYYCLNSTGHSAPRSGQDQYYASQRISRDELRPGDLLFFVGTYDTEGISHVGIYIGGGKMIDAEIYDVRIAWIDSEYWQSHFYDYGRIE